MFGRQAFLVTLALTAMTAAIFGLFPSLDFGISDFFEDTAPSFALHSETGAIILRQLGFVVPEIVMAGFAIVLLRKALQPRIPMFADARAITAVLLTFILGSGLLVNVILKDHWGRPRPYEAIAASERGDVGAFRPWWDPRGSCKSNCSFVSGEASTAMATIAAAAVMPEAVGGLALAATTILAIFVLTLRVAFGGHYVSDVLFGALFTEFIAIGMMRLMHDPRWPPGREGIIERWLERRGAPLRRVLGPALAPLRKRLARL